MTRPGTSVTAPYPLDNAAVGADAHHHGLAHLLDPFSRLRLILLDDWIGARVLEVGCGRGSFALLLADLVGSDGHVTATDLKPPSLGHDRITVVAHDLTGDEPPPGEPYNLIHSRLVLQHLPSREDILDRLITLLPPGGALVEEAWYPVRRNPVIAAPNPDAKHLYERFAKASGRVFDNAGTDPTWAKHVHTAMTDRGLTDVDTLIHGSYWRGGGVGTRMIAGTIPQLTEGLLAEGMSQADIDAVQELLEDPELLLHSHLLYSTVGYLPYP